jgi:restriction system protein
MPAQVNIELPLLRVIEDAGGQLSLSESVQAVAKYYPGMRPEDLASTLDSGVNRWSNRVQWARQELKSNGELTSAQHGIWAITDKGRGRLAKEWKRWAPKYSAGAGRPIVHVAGDTARKAATDRRRVDEWGRTEPEEALEQGLEQIRKAVADQLLERARRLTPSLFEGLVRKLLEKIGYSNVQVTGRSGDGGIDGVGSIDRLGMIKITFQAKKWQEGNTVGSQEVDKFLGAIRKHHADYGVFVTTSTYSHDAWGIREKIGNLRLIDGEELAKLMIEAGLGVSKTTLQVPRIDEDFFSGLA